MFCLCEFSLCLTSPLVIVNSPLGVIPLLDCVAPPHFLHRMFDSLVYFTLHFSVAPCEFFVCASLIPVFCSLVFLRDISKSCYLFSVCISHLSVEFFCDPSPQYSSALLFLSCVSFLHVFCYPQLTYLMYLWLNS